jgi:hypothetical protein
VANIRVSKQQSKSVGGNRIFVTKRPVFIAIINVPIYLISMFANFVRGLRDKAPGAILEVSPHLGEVGSHARTYHMPGDSLESVR